MNIITINGTNVDIQQEKDKIIYSYFACTCSKEDRDFWEKAIKDHFEDDVPEFPVSGLIMELEWSYNASITSIFTDMWFGICIESQDGNIFIQADLVEYGILAAIMILQELRNGKGAMV